MAFRVTALLDNFGADDDPLCVVVTFFETLVPVFRTVTFTPITAAPEESVTTPLMVPVIF